MDKELIQDNNGSHGFDNGNSTRDNTRIVTTASGEGTLCAIILGSLLGLGDGSGGFESNTKAICALIQVQTGNRWDVPEVDVLRIGYTSLDTSTPVGPSAELPICATDEGIIVPASWDFSSTEARANFEGLSSRD